MASYLGFLLTYPYQRDPPNPTNDGRGNGRGSVYRTRLMWQVKLVICPERNDRLTGYLIFAVMENRTIGEMSWHE